ncbi:MAG: helix-turn-helix domain-containing protein [Candidatus Omnitrophica bacterium]|nr:helix-turn-helix domain-containing protein [Candidatus Omnitrophota bacterium]
MAEEKLLTVRDVSIILHVSEKKVLELAESGEVPAYKIGGVYLRFKKEQVYEYKKRLHPHAAKEEAAQKYSLNERIKDFLYFNDFYVFSAIVITVLLFVIFRGY